MTFNPKEYSFTIPVYVDIDPSSVEVVGSDMIKDPFPGYGRVQEMVKRGLRAQLATQSVVTGQLMVSLDFFPDKPAKYIGADTRYPEVPTIPTTLEQIGARLEKIPIDEIVDKLNGSLDGINKPINSPEMIQLVKSTAKSVEDDVRSFETWMLRSNRLLQI